VCSQAGFRSRPFPDDFALPGPGPVHDRLDEPRLALATREWAETYVRPLLVRPLTVLQLPEIFRAGVFLSWLAEVGGEVCVVEIQFTTSVDGGHIFYAGTEGLELYSISVGSLDHCRVQLRHPSSGITALVLHDLSRLDFEQILAQVPNLEYLMHFDNGPNRKRSDTCQSSSTWTSPRRSVVLEMRRGQNFSVTCPASRSFAATRGGKPWLPPRDF